MNVYDYIDNLIADGTQITRAEVSTTAASVPLAPTYRGVTLATGTDQNLTQFFNGDTLVAKVLWLEPAPVPA